MFIYLIKKNSIHLTLSRNVSNQTSTKHCWYIQMILKREKRKKSEIIQLEFISNTGKKWIFFVEN